MSLEGDEKLVKMLRASAKGAAVELAGPLNTEAELIMTDAKQNYVPKDQGILVNSGVVQSPDISRHKVTVELGFGGAASAYALAVHEHPSKHSPPSWQGKTVNFSPAGHGPKYLERPVKEAAKDFPRRLARRVDVFKKR